MVYQLECAAVGRLTPPLDWEPEGYRATYGDTSWGGTVIDDGRPRTIRIASSRHKVMPDFHTPGLWLISEAAKSVFEGLEPGVHRYYPVDVFLKNRTPTQTKHFVLDVCRRVDALIFEESDLIRVNDSGSEAGYVAHRALGTRTHPLMFDAARIDGLHLWQNRTMLPMETYCSDQVHAEINRLKLTNLRWRHHRSR